jgi:hypothetical protein
MKQKPKKTTQQKTSTKNLSKRFDPVGQDSWENVEPHQPIEALDRLTISGPPPRLNVSLGLTLNLDNFESLKVGAGYSADLKPGQTIEEAYEEMWKVVELEIENKRDEVRTAMKKGKI